MRINIEYLENDIEFIDGYVNVIEIENKKYFYRIINDFYKINNDGISDNIKLFNNINEVNVSNKFNIILNYFDFEFDSKKCSNDIAKYLIQEIDDSDKSNIINQYNLLIKKVNKVVSKVDLPLLINNTIDINTIIKNIKIEIDQKEELLDNLFLIIDLEKTLSTNRILIFVNLKQYLNKVELEELYKYSIYNNIKIVLIDAQCYGGTLNYENKLIIDSNLDELVIKCN